ncbi:MAG: hypothetical protein LBC99_01745 [Spirochaetota bacterium]|nr:hypothetical protein [Spirochaetota bacterium]
MGYFSLWMKEVFLARKSDPEKYRTDMDWYLHEEKMKDMKKARGEEEHPVLGCLFICFIIYLIGKC